MYKFGYKLICYLINWVWQREQKYDSFGNTRCRWVTIGGSKLAVDGSKLTWRSNVFSFD